MQIRYRNGLYLLYLPILYLRYSPTRHTTKDPLFWGALYKEGNGRIQWNLPPLFSCLSCFNQQPLLSLSLSPPFFSITQIMGLGYIHTSCMQSLQSPLLFPDVAPHPLSVYFRDDCWLALRKLMMRSTRNILSKVTRTCFPKITHRLPDKINLDLDFMYPVFSPHRLFGSIEIHETWGSTQP